MSIHQQQKSVTNSSAVFPNERSPSISDSSDEEDDDLDDESAEHSAVRAIYFPWIFFVESFVLPLFGRIVFRVILSVWTTEKLFLGMLIIVFMINIKAMKANPSTSWWKIFV